MTEPRWGNPLGRVFMPNYLASGHISRDHAGENSRKFAPPIPPPKPTLDEEIEGYLAEIEDRESDKRVSKIRKRLATDADRARVKAREAEEKSRRLGKRYDKRSKAVLALKEANAIVKAVKAGMTLKRAAMEFHQSPKTVAAVIKTYETENCVSIRKQTPKRKQDDQ